MAISNLNNVTYNDFQLQQIIDPDRFDTNFQDCVDKIDEIIDYCNTLDDTTDGASGADLIAVTNIAGVTGGTVQAVLEDLKTQIDNLVIGAIAPGSIEENMLNFTIYTDSEVDAITGDKSTLTTSTTTSLVAAINELVTTIGALASLDTSAKTSLVAAANELHSDLATHKSSDTDLHLNVMTTQGDMVYRGASIPQRLAVGSARQVLAVNTGATGPTWVDSLQSLMTAQGDVLYASAANTPARLAKGTAGQSLVMNSGATAPEWGAVSASGTFTLDYHINASSSYTHTIALPFAATHGMCLITGVNINYGLTIYFNTVSGDSMSVEPNLDGSHTYQNTRDSKLSTGGFGDGVDTEYISVISARINGTNLEIVFQNTDSSAHHATVEAAFYQVFR